MKVKMNIYVLLFLGLLVFGFVLPRIVGKDVPDDQQSAVFVSLEPVGLLYPGMRYIEKLDAEDRCVDRGLKQILIQTYSWMFIPGPVVELCVYKDNTEMIKSAGVLEF